MNLQIAFNYGARAEITHALQKIIESGKKEITEDLISQNLYTAGMPDPDLLIRTGGELRISNFLLWQAAYSEILVLQKFWPDFDKEELAGAIMEYQHRQRRYGR